VKRVLVLVKKTRPAIIPSLKAGYRGIKTARYGRRTIRFDPGIYPCSLRQSWVEVKIIVDKYLGGAAENVRAPPKGCLIKKEYFNSCLYADAGNHGG
jgi:hypothetical protein